MLLWVAGTDGGCDFFNKPWLEFRGRTLDEERGRGWEEGIHPDDRTGFGQAYHEAFTRRQDFRIEYRLRRADDVYRWVLNTGVPHYHPDGSFAGYIGSALDLTERRQAEEDLRSANRAKDEFLTMLAHELRNPLAPLSTSIQILRLGAGGPAREQALDMMGRQLRHLTRLVDDLLDVSRLVRGKVRLQPERLDLARLVRTTVEDRRPALDQAGLALTLDVPGPPVWVQGDPTRLAQVLTNLLDNAVKFTDRGGSVHLRLAADREPGPRNGERAVLTISDTGIGIEPDVLPRLFQTFAQADRSLARTRGGLGLGLSVVKSLIDLHGGEVRVHSPGPGQGAEFTILLPLEPEPAALTGLPSWTHPSSQSLRILVVEDNRDAAESLRLLLEMCRHEVAVAYTGTDGVEAARRFHPQVVLCDLGLPGLSGYEVARTLRREPATAQVRMICVSGYGQEQDRRRAREAGFDAHVVKPVDPEVLQQLLVSA
jgi:PAS domain S-box-containing protein